MTVPSNITHAWFINKCITFMVFCKKIMPIRLTKSKFCQFKETDDDTMRMPSEPSL